MRRRGVMPPANSSPTQRSAFDSAARDGLGWIRRLAAQTAALLDQVTSFAGAGPRQIRRRRDPRHRRIRARADRAAHRAPAERVEHARRQRRAAAIRACRCSTTSIPRRSPRCSSGWSSRARLFVVTSKSGGTAETMAQFLIVHDRLDAAKLDVTKHLVFVTDPEQGALRPLADRLRVPALDIPAERRRAVQRAHAGRHACPRR